MRYHQPQKLTKTDAEQAFARGSAPEIQRALVAIALGEEDWRWVQEKCLVFTHHDEPGIRGLAATCLGHLARIHGQLDMHKVMPRLDALQRDPATAGRAETALDDIKMFILDRRP